ncbi:hypothetical protein HELRODRAFT_168839 [Helobdella robusta]|uniref:FLYWCH-type domain-containing protein n=1 Tax=Helobdella robusta TaxID=6412 RepID=T1F111_HELRO|nr:hypothetical protein HELRODRAFT_168839 [Helobdella robusta]ESO08919.1 hypothetical protein HELRODRAFT_168839 [Helobdella robusta]
MSLEFVYSEKRKRKLIDSGHLFVKDAATEEKTFWKCDQYQNLVCRARWHRAFSELIGASHPTVWKFISSLKDEQALNEGKIEQYVAGANPPPSKKKRLRIEKSSNYVFIIYNIHGVCKIDTSTYGLYTVFEYRTNSIRTVSSRNNIARHGTPSD